MSFGLQCKDCSLYKGDCGHHFKDEFGHINYEICAESACDRFGDCNFYVDNVTMKKRCIIALEECDIKDPCKSAIIKVVKEFMN